MRSPRSQLDTLRTHLLASRAEALPVHELAGLMREVTAWMVEVPQDDALAAAKEADLLASHCTPLLRRACLEDEDGSRLLAPFG